MALLGIDLGGTKVAFGIFNNQGNILYKDSVLLNTHSGTNAGELLLEKIRLILHNDTWLISSVGIAVPGIYNADSGEVWAPNIPGWEKFPLRKVIKEVCGNIPVYIDSDRACCIVGEVTFGNAIGCRNAIFITVGTGIGAGVLMDGRVLRGAHDIAGAIGWMGLKKPFETKYITCGCLEYSASGNGMARLARAYISVEKNYSGVLSSMNPKDITAHLIFEAAEGGDEIAGKVINDCIEEWGMAAANLVSILNPEMLIFGGGVFGPAISLIPAIKKEAEKWGQPVSMKKVAFSATALGDHAALLGAASLPLINTSV